MTLNRLSLAAVDFRYPDPSEPEPEIDLVLILQEIGGLQGQLEISALKQVQAPTTHFGSPTTPSMGSKSSRGAMITMNPVGEAIFGSRNAAWTLLFLQCYGEGHALRIGKTSGQKAHRP